MPVRRGPRRLGHADIPAASTDILHVEWLAEPLGQVLRDQPRGQVVRAARRERHDHPHRVVRIGLRPSAARQGGGGESQNRGTQKPAATNGHHASPG
jgi:hypothetical protein